MTQCEQIIKYMKHNGSITQREAVMLGCYRLSARIHDLRDAGFDIETRFETKGNSTYARYFMKEEKDVHTN